ncbi:hypothetical protein LCGC14_0594830 [marine sediment metagenome]|uniref:Uncharacterized protein n=1 Tax=marine sediment metagenome TaxID=412755 RepID=A0A0F9RCC3_9ZZZZ
MITLKLVDDEIGLELKHVILNGDGISPEKLIIEMICQKYNGKDKIILYPRTGIKRQAGLSALNAIKTLISRGYRNFIFIVDGEYIEEDEDPKGKIKGKLNAIGIGFGDEIIPLQDAFLLKCSCRPYEFNLFCIILGPEVCIEEEIAKFIELKLNVRVNIPEGHKNALWRRTLKQEIRSILSKRELKRQLREANLRIIEDSFPNMCAVLNYIEENFLQI